MVLPTEHFFDSNLAERLNAPAESGSALPNPAYVSHDYHQLEQNTVFRNNWVFAGFVHEIGVKGDVQPVEIAGQPILLVNTGNGIAAFHNVCKHRGALLVTSASGANLNLTCPNHAWSYSLDGRLLARPHFFGGGRHDINRETFHRANLAKVDCVTWHDWVFVNISGDAQPFDELIAPIETRLAGYDLACAGFASSMDFEVEANWKLAIENFIEPYHVFSCHPWLNGFVGMEERSPPEFEGRVLSCGYRFARSDPARGGQLPYFPGLSQEQQFRGDWFVLFPNFAFEIFPDQIDVFLATPLGVDRTRETIALYFVGDGISGEQYQNARAHVIDNWKMLNKEDIGVIERMQAGRASEGFDGGVLSPYWDPVQQHFARLIYDSLSSGT